MALTASQQSPGRVRLTGVTFGAALVAVAAVVTAFLLRDAFVAAHRIVGWVVACAMVALLLDPIVRFVQRFLPRWVSVIVVVVGVGAAFAGIAVGLVNQILDAIDDLEVAAPDAAEGLERRFRWAADVGVADRVERLVGEMQDSVREFTVNRAVGTVPTYIVTGILMLFLLAFGRRYVNGLIGLFDDAERRERGRAVIARTAVRGRTYLLFTIAHAVATGLVFGTVCWLLDLPAPLGLGVAVGIMTPLPLLGIVIGGVPALLLAFGSQAWWVGVVTLVTLFALQAVEALVVRPFVDTRTVRVGPAIPIVVGLLAFELYGVGGTVYAIALAVLALAAVDAIGWARGEDPHPENLEESGIAVDDMAAS